MEHSFLYGFTLGGSKAKGVRVKAEYLACRHEGRVHSSYLTHFESEQPSLKLPLVGPFQPENRLLLNALSKGLLTYKLHPATIRTVPLIGRRGPLEPRRGATPATSSSAWRSTRTRSPGS